MFENKEIQIISSVPVWVVAALRAGWCLWRFLPTTWSASASPWQRGWSVRAATHRLLRPAGHLRLTDRPVGRGP